LPGRIALALVDETNHFQQLLKADAEAAGRKAGLEVETLFTGQSLAEHLGALRRLIVAPERRPAALLVMAVRDHGLDRVVREAAAAGVHFVFLNAVEDDLDAVRREFPSVVVCTVCPDEVETGRVQGHQLRALAPPASRVLYIQGSPRSLASRQRTAGMKEATPWSARQISVFATPRSNCTMTTRRRLVRGSCSATFFTPLLSIRYL